MSLIALPVCLCDAFFHALVTLSLFSKIRSICLAVFYLVNIGLIFASSFLPHLLLGMPPRSVASCTCMLSLSPIRTLKLTRASTHTEEKIGPSLRIRERQQHSSRHDYPSDFFVFLTLPVVARALSFSYSSRDYCITMKERHNL
jgi:hypothetical protein